MSRRIGALFIMSALALVTLVTFQNCSGGGGGSGSSGSSGSADQAASKNIWSTWTTTAQNGTKLTLYLEGGQFNASEIFSLIAIENGSNGLPVTIACICNFLAVGTNTGGDYAFTGCGNAPGNTNGNCSVLNDSGTYTNDGTNLKACSSVVNSCTTYQ